MLNQFREAFRNVPWGLPFTYLMIGVRWALGSLWEMKWARRSIYAVGSLAVLYVFFWGFTIFNLFGLNTYEDGWHQGTLADYTLSNRVFSSMPIPPGWLFPTGEGTILLGNDSSHSYLNGKSVSPAAFSSGMDVYTENHSLSGQSVAVHYRKLVHSVFFGGETDIRVDRIEKVAPDTLPASCAESHGWLSKKYGNLGGKIVTVASVGEPLLWHTYEIVVHSGGNEFKEMSIIDSAIYECALRALKTGMPVLITYDDQAIRDPVTQNTTYNLIGIATQK